MSEAINLNEKLDLFAEQWQAKMVAQINDYDVRVVKVQGEFVWRSTTTPTSSSSSTEDS